MNRVRPVEALLAALATLAVTLPVTTLFTPSTWFRPSVVLVLAVMLTGMGLRRLTSSRPLVVLGQVTVLVYAASLLHGRGHLWADLVPTPETGQAFGILLTQAHETVTNSSAPAPSDRGTILAISLLVGLTAVAVDAIGVTYRSPALAGIPLLSAYLGSATNSGEGLAAWYAVPAALSWLALVGRQGVLSLRSWGTSAPRSSGAMADPTTAFATTGRVVGAAAVAAAVLVPTLLPHLPTTFLADGLGQSENARGGGGGSVRLSSSIDIARDLGSRSDDPVLRYRTTSDDLQPLRVGILDSYRRGQWEASPDRAYVPVDGQIPGPLAASEVPRRVERIAVTQNAVGVPQVALPAGAIGAPFPAGTWNVTAVGGLVQVSQPVRSYTAEFVELDPEATQFAADEGDLPVGDATLELDRRSEAEVRALLAELTDEGDSALEVARSVQSYLRSTAFTYSLDLAEEEADGSLPGDPLVRFLETKRGYCVQFSSAMIMLSRAAGIPARMAVGFLPGVADGDEQVVRVSDAHAWPELFFPRLGWVRFEPTPGTRSNTAPEYSLAPTDPAATAGPEPSATTPSSTAAPSAGPTRDVTADGLGTTGGGAGESLTRFVSDHVVTVVVILLGALAVAAVPFGAWLSRRRAHRRARDDADRVEAEWQSLLLRLQDIGFVPPDGATPRQASRQIGRAAYLTAQENDALGRVVSTLERARYARPGADLDDVTDDARTVWRGALSRRRRSDRVRAVLLPEEGRRLWRDAVRGLVPTRRRADPPASEE